MIAGDNKVIGVGEDWLASVAVAAYDALKADPSRAIPAEDVRARFEAKWIARRPDRLSSRG